MTDRELLGLAAKAAGLTSPQYEQSVAGNWNIYHGDVVDPRECWNPLDDDGDALRLAVKLGLYIDNEQERSGCVTVSWGCDSGGEHLGSVEEDAPEGGDDYAATRRAIVRAAAEIGQSLDVLTH